MRFYRFCGRGTRWNKFHSKIRQFKNFQNPGQAWDYLDVDQELATAENQSLAELMDTQGPAESEEQEAKREEREPSESHNQLSMPHFIQLSSFF